MIIYMSYELIFRCDVTDACKDISIFAGTYTQDWGTFYLDAGHTIDDYTPSTNSGNVIWRCRNEAGVCKEGLWMGCYQTEQCVVFPHEVTGIINDFTLRCENLLSTSAPCIVGCRNSGECTVLLFIYFLFFHLFFLRGAFDFLFSFLRKKVGKSWKNI